MRDGINIPPHTYVYVGLVQCTVLKFHIAYGKHLHAPYPFLYGIVEIGLSWAEGGRHACMRVACEPLAACVSRCHCASTTATQREVPPLFHGCCCSQGNTCYTGTVNAQAESITDSATTAAAAAATKKTKLFTRHSQLQRQLTQPQQQQSQHCLFPLC